MSTEGTFSFEQMKSFIEAIKTLSQDSCFQSVSAVVDETTRLEQEIRRRDEDLEMANEKVQNVQTAVHEMFEVHRTQKTKHDLDLERMAALEATIADKENTITQRDEDIQRLNQVVADLEDSNRAEKGKLEEADQKITELNDTYDKKDQEAKKYKEAGQKLKRLCDASESKTKELEEQNSSLNQNLQQTSEKLNELQSYAVAYTCENEEALQSKYDSLWDSASQSLVIHLKDDLPIEKLQNYQDWRSWKLLKDDRTAHHVPLPPTNSDPAKQMRFAVILAILAREINEQIFQPTYLFSSESEVREILDSLAMENPKKESFCRALLLSIEPEEQKNELEERKRNVVKEVGSYLEPLLSPDQFQNIQGCLMDIVQQAAETWQLFQYNANRYEPDFEDDSVWNSFGFADETGVVDGRLANGELDDTALVIFPRLCRVGENQRTPHNWVTVLRRSQCVAAEQELRRRDPSSPSHPRRKARSMSFSLGNPNGNGNGPFLDNNTSSQSS